MGKIETDHTGSGGGITLSSDGTSLLLDGTAVGGGASELTFLQKAANYTITNGDLGKFIQNTTSSTITFDLPAVADISTGWYVYIQARSGECIIDSNISFGINFSTTFTLEKGGTAKVVFNGSGFYLFQEPSNVSLGGIALGDNAFASQSADATAIGKSTSATGSSAVALGSFAVSAGSGSVALRNSRASGTDAFAAAIANNTSSYGATGANSVAIGYLAKATQTYAATLAGFRGQATNSGATSVGGFDNIASGIYSVALGGRSNTSNGQYSYALGYGAHTQGVNRRVAFAGNGVSGETQSGWFSLGRTTSDATPIALTTDVNGTPSTTNQIILPNNSAYAFHGTIVAREQASSGTDCAAWKIEGLIRREGSASTTVLVNSATTVLDNTPSWGMALSADTTNGGLKIQVTGAASTNIRWVATINTSEVTY